MELSRREFLKMAGLASVGIAASAPAITLLTQTGTSRVRASDGSLEGKRWAMVVDASKCKEGCTKCVEACHSIHNVPDFSNDPKHIVKWIWPATFNEAFTEQENHYIEEHMKGYQFMLLCNHCSNPPCVRVCPTGATYKREDGIVMMDYHRCIGCRFCMAACPYGSRSMNWKDPRKGLDMSKVNPDYPTRTKGMVEKCNFCEERLAKGLQPACVEACPNGALVFGNLEEEGSEVRKLLASQFALQRKVFAGTEPNVYYLV